MPSAPTSRSPVTEVPLAKSARTESAGPEEQARGGRPRDRSDQGFRAGLELVINGIAASPPQRR